MMAAKDTNNRWLLNFRTFELFVCFEKCSKSRLSGKAEFKFAIIERVLQAYFEFSTLIIMRAIIHFSTITLMIIENRAL